MTQSPRDDPHLSDLHCDDVEDYGTRGLPGHWRMLQFWEKSRFWFAKRGLNLYETSDKLFNGTQCYYWVNHVEVCEKPARLPFATCIPSDSKTLRPTRWIGRFGFAHDSEHRDVVIRLVNPHSDHYRIFRRLHECEEFSDPDRFPCVLPPLAILDTPYNFSFVTMPMWGSLSGTSILNMETVGEVLRFMDCTLRGLAFLHSFKIAHRDIDEVNIMVNYYRYDHDLEIEDEDLPSHRKTGHVSYALMDYNQSIVLPADTCVKTCRRPAHEALYGSGVYKPWDIALGEPTYNPFAYDVGMLGNLFRIHLTEIAPYIPGFAALFDRMTTWVVPQRFTAEEALEFYHNTTSTLTNEALHTPLNHNTTSTLTNEALHTPLKLKVPRLPDEYWNMLKPEVYHSWSRFRTPPVTWWSNVLEWFLRYRLSRCIILIVRRFLNL